MTPPDRATADYLYFCLVVRALATTYHASVTSWWRTRARNDAVGGHTASRHMLGLGADLRPDTWTDTPRIIAAAHEAGLDAVAEAAHVHVELDTTHAAPTP